jgi:hypothetical protein
MAMQMRGLFVESCGPDVTLPLWDLYLLNEDPFLVFFLALVMVLNARDPVMEMGDHSEGVVGLLQSMPTVGAVSARALFSRLVRNTRKEIQPVTSP